MGPNQPISLDERKEERKPLVLVVDDDPIHHKLLNLLADALGITCHVAASCSEAMEALSMFSFDVVLMDYRMPEVDGCACTQRIRAMKEKTGQIPIIAVTGRVTNDSREECLAAGMNDYLAKPFTLEELHEKLNLWLHKKEE